ncbi:hypothetical protein ACF05L_02685 [Streptomyces bobili]|uniref:hypothetical protein n=1 Tax=Streptomyces bobili TaxID=67280 RepID=UPI0036F7E21B
MEQSCRSGARSGRNLQVPRDGVESGAFTVPGPAETEARALCHATGRFHDPCCAREWGRAGQGEFEAVVVDLLLRGLHT